MQTFSCFRRIYSQLVGNISVYLDVDLNRYKEIFDYDFAAHRGKDHKTTGHFTQVVWKASVNIGVGIAYGKNSNGDASVYIVGRYDPPGNFNMKNISNMKNNVHPRKAGKVFHGDFGCSK